MTLSAHIMTDIQAMKTAVPNTMVELIFSTNKIQSFCTLADQHDPMSCKRDMVTRPVGFSSPIPSLSITVLHHSVAR